MSDKKITQDYLNGINQALDSLQVNIKSGKSITQEDIDFERKHWNGMEVIAPSASELSKAEIASKAAQVRELNKALKEADESIKSINAGIEKLPESFCRLGETLSVLKQ